MKHSVKFITALAAIALLVVAVAGVAKTTQASHGPDHENGSVALDEAWYDGDATVTITVTDPDRDVQIATTSIVSYVNNDGFQSFTIAPNVSAERRCSSSCFGVQRWVTNCIRSAEVTTSTPRLRTNSIVPASTLDTLGNTPWAEYSMATALTPASIAVNCATISSRLR